MLNVAAVEAVEFSVVKQAVRAVLRDRLGRVLEPIEWFTGELDNKLHRLDWDTGPAIRYLLEFVVFAKSAQELLI